MACRSYSPLIALYFAAQEDKDCPEADGCLWALEPRRMNSWMLNLIGVAPSHHPSVVNHAEIAFGSDLGLPPPKTPVAMGAREIDPRILAQQGAFTIHADGADLADMPHDTRAGTKSVLARWRRAFRVPKVAKQNLRRTLERLSIRKSTLFPDLAALAEDLKQRWATEPMS
jgi:hypothetical protein